MTIKRNNHANNLGIVNMELHHIRSNVLEAEDFFVQTNSVSVFRGSSSDLEKTEIVFSFTDFMGEKTLMYTKTAITLRSIKSVVIGTGSPAANMTLHYNSIRSATGTEIIDIDCANTTTGLVSTDFSTSVIPKDSWIWLTFDETSENLDQVDLVINY